MKSRFDWGRQQRLPCRSSTTVQIPREPDTAAYRGTENQPIWDATGAGLTCSREYSNGCSNTEALANKTFPKLRVDRKGGSLAPHKPLLLLVIIEMAQHGLVPSRVLRLSPELAFRFYTYWTVVAYRRTQEPDIRYPFYHLQSDGFWAASR